MVGSVAPRPFPIIAESSRSSIVVDIFNSSLEILKVRRRNMATKFREFLENFEAEQYKNVNEIFVIFFQRQTT